MCQSPLFIGADQPLRRDFGITHVPIGEMLVPVYARDVLTMPFFSLAEFVRADIAPRADLLVVPPLSGHFPVVLRDLVLGLLPDFRVYAMDWLNVRHIPVDRGSFGLDTNIASLLSGN
jgi:poly(3-hydroxybutyrate) depolymerase